MPAVPPPAPLLAALDALLATQPAARARLAGHAGKIVRLVLPGVNLDLAVDDGGGLTAAPAAGEVALRLTPEPAALPRWLTGGTLNELFRAEGDGLLAADLARALADFDWVLALRPWLGDIAASRVDAFLRALAPWRQQAMTSAGRNLAEYAVHEAGLLADPHAIRAFVAEVDALREAADRLQARLELLEIRRSA